MILSDQTIKMRLQNRDLEIDPLEEAQLQPASVDIRLKNTFTMVEDASSSVIQLSGKMR